LEQEMNDQQCKEFLVWLINRLERKYGESPEVLEKINHLISHKKIIDERISVSFINGLCNKYYPGFSFEKIEDLSLGYTNHEKKEIYSLVSSIIIDTINQQQ
jgi:hypothetical protein